MSDPKAIAAAYLAGIVADPTATPSARLRAAEAILRNDSPKPTAGRATRAMTDAELEAAARGEGGTPPEKGPATGVTKTGPIREGTINPTTPLPVPGGRTPQALSLQPSVEGPRRRGPKRGTPGSGPIAGGAESGEDVDPLS